MLTGEICTNLSCLIKRKKVKGLHNTKEKKIQMLTGSCVFCIFYRFGVNMANFPIVSRINAALSNLEAFKLAHPSQQPDCPDESRNVQ